MRQNEESLALSKFDTLLATVLISDITFALINL